MNNEDLKHLRLLTIFHYVVGGIIALFSLFPVIHLVIGISILTGSFFQEADPDFPAPLFGLMFTVIPLIIIVCGLAFAVVTIIAGRKLSNKQSHTFCLVVAGLLCTFTPFGTVLGVFTIIVLMRDSVKELFNKELPDLGNAPPNWK